MRDRDEWLEAKQEELALEEWHDHDTAQTQQFAVYNGTAGSVNRPASIARAEAEATDGTLSARQASILQMLEWAGASGCTWKVLGNDLGLHHGQVSGALTNMHAAGVVFMLRQTTDRCHRYVHAKYRSYFTDDEVYDRPAKTRSGQRRELLDGLLAACRDAINNEFDWDRWQRIIDVVVMIDAHERNAETESRVRGQS